MLQLSSWQVTYHSQHDVLTTVTLKWHKYSHKIRLRNVQKDSYNDALVSQHLQKH